MRAASSRSSGMLYVLAKEEHCERGNHCRQHDGGVGVHQPQLAHQQKQRHHFRLKRNDHGDQNERKAQLAVAKPALLEDVAGHRAEQELRRHDVQRGVEGVPVGPRQGNHLEHPAKVVERDLLRDQGGREPEHLTLRLDGRGDHPVEGRDIDHRHGPQHQVEQQPPGRQRRAAGGPRDNARRCAVDGRQLGTHRLSTRSRSA